MKRAFASLFGALVLTTAASANATDETSPSPPVPERRFAVRAAVITSHELSREDVPSGTAGELDAMVRLRASRHTRFDLGIEGRTFDSQDARHHSVGPIAEAVLEAGRHFELAFAVAPHRTWIDFKSPLWEDARAFGTRLAWSGQLVLGDRVLVTLSPLAMTVTRGNDVGTLWQYEPRFGFGVIF